MMAINMQRRIKTNISAKLNWSLKLRSVQDNELGNRQVGSDICCCGPFTVVKESMPIH